MRGRLNVFPVSRLEMFKRILIIGGTTSGKTTALHQMVGHMHANGKRKNGRGIEFGIGMSKTENANGNLGGPVKDNDGVIEHKYSLFPRMLVRHGFNEPLLKDFMAYQIATKAAGRMRNAIFVGDDIMCDKALRKSDAVKELQMNARNFGLGAFWTTHTTKQMDSDSRTQFHFIGAFDMPMLELEKFYNIADNHAFPTFKAFKQSWKLLHKEEHWMMIIDMHAKGDKSNRAFKWRAVDPDLKRNPTYTIPHVVQPGFWWISQQCFTDPAMANMQKLFDLTDLLQQNGVDVPKISNGTEEDGTGKGRSGRSVITVGGKHRPKAFTINLDEDSDDEVLIP